MRTSDNVKEVLSCSTLLLVVTAEDCHLEVKSVLFPTRQLKFDVSVSHPPFKNTNVRGISFPINANGGDNGIVTCAWGWEIYNAFYNTGSSVFVALSFVYDHVTVDFRRFSYPEFVVLAAESCGHAKYGDE